MECENKSDARNNRGDWNDFKSTQAIPEQRARRARNLGTAKKESFVDGTHTAESTNVKTYKTHFTDEITLHVSTNCKYRTAATLYTLET